MFIKGNVRRRCIEPFLPKKVPKLTRTRLDLGDVEFPRLLVSLCLECSVFFQSFVKILVLLFSAFSLPHPTGIDPYQRKNAEGKQPLDGMADDVEIEREYAHWVNVNGGRGASHYFFHLRRFAFQIASVFARSSTASFHTFGKTLIP